MYTAGKISTCPDQKNHLPSRAHNHKILCPWDKIYMPRACGHTLVSYPEGYSDVQISRT